MDMALSTLLFNFYKKFGVIFKIVLCPLLIVIFVLWLVGNLAHLNTLFMFVIGVIVATVLLYFYHEPVFEFVDKIVEMVNTISNTFGIKALLF